jgi:HlyD family secretion protein/epimerase transport system membrane fusion protein
VLPLLTGRVDVVSGDAQIDERTGTAFYAITVTVPSAALQGAEAHVLKPGMPAEVMVLTGERTLMEYLLEPLSAAMRQALIE